MGFTLDDAEFRRELEQFSSKVDAALMMYCQNQASNLQSYAQQNAPWTDRTTMARQRLKGSAERTETGYAIEIAHGVDYGKWLELANDERYAIAKPTILNKAGEVLEGLNVLLTRL